MSTYIITFEINDSRRKANFTAGIQALTTGYCPIHENAWAITTNLTATAIRDTLLVHLTNSDRLFVIRSGTEAAWQNSYGQANTDWLKNYL